MVRPGVVADVVDAELEAIGGGFVTNEQFAVSHESVPSGLGENNNVYLRPPGGSEGWGVGAAIGAKLAATDKPVVGFVGDGSLYYADSGIWTAVHHNIPVLYIITNNRAYGIVAGFFGEAEGRMSDTGKYGGDVLEVMDPVNIAEAIGMVKVPDKWGQNAKSIMPQIDYGKCVFCGLCVDACPFYALYMSNDYELSSFTKEGLIYTPAQLQVKPQVQQDSELIIDKRGARHG